MYPNYPNQQPNYSSNYGFNPDPGYPTQPGYNPNPGYGGPSYPQQPGYPPQPSYPNQPGYPSQQPNYPPQSGYPSQPGFPSGPSYPPQPNFDNSYNPNNSGGYPPYQPGPPPPPPSGPYNNPSIDNFYNPQQPYPGSNPYPGQGFQNDHGAVPYNPQPFNQPNPGYENNFGGIYPNLNPGAQNFNNYGQTTYYEGTVKRLPFNPNEDAAKLRKAMKGFGTDEKALIDVLCRRTFDQRREIAMAYKTGYGKDLVQDIKSEVSGNLELVLKSLLRTPAELEAHDLKKAIDGLGTDEEALIDVMCTKTNSEMLELKDAYRRMYSRDLEKDVRGDVSGYFKRLIVSLAAAHRADNPPDHARAAQQANELYTAGARTLGTDEVTFNRIFASESFPHLRVVFDEYRKRAGHDIEQAIKSEMSGFVEKAFLAVVHTARNPPAYYAERLHDAMAGFGTKERTLVRLIALRCERDMVQIKQEFQRRYGKSLESHIKGDTTGDFERALLTLIQ